MTNQEWKRRLDLISGCIIASQWNRATSKSTGYWVIIGVDNDKVGVMTGGREDSPGSLRADSLVMYPWGSKVDLANELGISNESAPLDVFADALLDRVMAGTWDKSRDGHWQKQS